MPPSPLTPTLPPTSLPHTQMFIMSEVAAQLFQESPLAFGKVRGRCQPFRILPRRKMRCSFLGHFPLFVSLAFPLLLPPPSFSQDLRAGRYPKTHTTNPRIMATCAALGAPEETSGSVVGVTLLPSETVEACLTDRRRAELVQPFRLALLKLSSQDAARLMVGDVQLLSSVGA
jgi:hypothetical protein